METVARKKGHVDFTQGSLAWQLILFAMPILLGEFFQNFYNSVDSLVVGNFVGKNALAAVSVGTTIANLLVGFFSGMSAGVSVVISQLFGKHEPEPLQRAIRASFTFSALLGFALSVLGIALTPVLLKIVDVPAEVYAESFSYVQIYLAGLMFTVIYNVGAGILRAIGDSRTPFWILVATCLVNIVLDLLFVTKMALGVAGVAYATVISQLLSVLLIVWRIRRYDSTFRLTLSKLPQEKAVLASVLSIGVPAGLQNALISFSNLFVFRYVSSFNAATMSGVGVAQRLDKFVSMPVRAFGLSITTLVGQNVGAEKYDRIRKGFRVCLVLAVAVTGVLGVGAYIFADECVRLFNSDPEVVSVGVAMMRCLIPFYEVMAVRQVFEGVLRGYGDTRIPMYLSILGMIVIRQVYLAVSMGIEHTIWNIYICYPLAWIATAILTIGYYLIVRKRYRGLAVERRACP